MLKEFSWKTFEDTGDIEAYMVYKQVLGKNASDNINVIAQEEIAISK